MKEIMSTEWCYEGFSTKEDGIVTGPYEDLSDDEHIDEDTIEWSYWAWEDEKNYFMNYLEKEIAAYERRYRTSVTHIGMIGSVGVWRGNFVGGKLIRYGENPLEEMGKVDHVRLYLDDDNTLRVDGIHHDGCHCMTLHFLTENKLRKMAPEVLEWDDYCLEDIQNIYDNDKPFKVTSIYDQYFSRSEAVAA